MSNNPLARSRLTKAIEYAPHTGGYQEWGRWAHDNRKTIVAALLHLLDPQVTEAILNRSPISPVVSENIYRAITAELIKEDDL